MLYVCMYFMTVIIIYLFVYLVYLFLIKYYFFIPFGIIIIILVRYMSVCMLYRVPYTCCIWEDYLIHIHIFLNYFFSPPQLRNARLVHSSFLKLICISELFPIYISKHLLPAGTPESSNISSLP